MKVRITSGENVFLVADQTMAVSNEGSYHNRLLNELALEEQFDALGTAPVTIQLSLRNDDAFIPYDIDLWSADVMITANNGRSWAGKVTAFNNDENWILNVEATEKTAPELKFYFPDEINRIYTIDENLHWSAINATLPMVVGGNDANPLRLKGLLVNTEEGIYAFCVGEIHKFVGVRVGGETLSVAEANSRGYATFTGSPSQANYPGMVYIQITDETLRKNDDGTYVELGAELVGLKFGTHTIEECRNGARALYWIMKTPTIGASGWGLGIADSDINTDSINAAISAVDAAGLKLDGVFYFKQIAMSWIRQICLAIRGTYSISSNGLRSLFVDAPASSIKTYTINNMRLLNHGKGAFTGRVYNLGELDYGYNPITGVFMQKAQYQNSASIDKIGEQKFYGQSYLINDGATAQAIVEYTCKRSLIAAEKVLFETDDLPTEAKKGSVITIDRPEKGIAGLYQISKLKITDHVYTIEAEKCDVNSFVVGGTGTKINWTEELPVVATINPGQASGLTLSSEVRPGPDGTNIVVLKGSFSPPAGGYLAATIEYAQGILPILSWTDLGFMRGENFEIPGVEPGQPYAVRIRMVSANGKSDYITGTITVQGDDIPPGAPSITVSSYLKTVTIKCVLSPYPSDMAGFEIFRHTSNNSAAAQSIGKIDGAQGIATFQDTETAYGMTYYYWAKAYDTWKNPSGFSASKSTFITFVQTSDLADQILSESRLFAQGVVDAAALSNAALKQAGGAVAAWSAKGCTTASISVVGGVVDTTGNGNNGISDGGVSVIDTEIGRAFSFDGANDTLQFAAAPFRGAAAFTVLMRIRTAGLAPGMTLNGYWASQYLPVAYAYPDGKMLFAVRNGAGSTVSVVDPYSHFDNEWHTFAFIADGTTIKILKDGLQAASLACAGLSWPGWTGSFYIGRNPNDAPYFGKFECFNFRYYNRALTPSEVKAYHMFPDDAVFARISADFIGTYELVSRHFASDSVVARAIAAKAVTMEKLLVGAPGAALNDDPGFMDASAWETMDGFETYTGWTLATISDGKVGTGVMRGNGSASPNANNFVQKRHTPIDLSKTYRLHCLARKRDAATNGSIYLSAREYDNSKAVLSSNAGHYLMSNIAPGTTWTEYNATIGPKGQFQFPAGTAFVRIGGMMDYNTAAGAGYELQDFRLEECTPSTLIQNGAILGQHLTVEEAVITVAAQIADLVVENAHIKSLHGGKVEAGTLAITGLESSAQTKINDAYTTANTALTDAAAAQSTANTAGMAAAAAQASANNAQSSANTANNLLADIAADNKLTPLEKQDTRQEWDIIAAEKAGIRAQAAAFGIATEDTTYNNAFQALANYLNAGTTWSSGIPSWISDANLGTTTTIVGATFRSTWKAYYDARTALLNAIAAKAKALADAAQSAADAASSAASAAASSAATASTKAGNLATTGLGVKVNYSSFIDANPGELYLHGFDSATGAAADVDGWVTWNGAKITVAKGMINPGAICPYNIPLYAVQRSGTKYIVWFDTASMGWKYAAADATAVLGTWAWAISTDIVLLTFASPSNEGAIVGTQAFVPPKTGRDIQDALDAAILSWAVANNLTYIDGAKIFTDSIYAQSINASAIKAPAGAALNWSAKGATTATIAIANGVKDVSGRNQHATAYGGIGIVDTVFGRAFDLDGINDYAITSAALGLTVLTKSVRAKIDSFTSQWSAFLSTFNGSNTGWNMVPSSASAMRFVVGRSSGGYQFKDIAVTLDTTSWHTYTATLNTATRVISLYIDGVFIGSTAAFDATAVFTAANGVMGRWSTGYGGYYFDGQIAEPVMFSRVLNDAEIKTLHMIGINPESGTMTADRVVAGQLKSTNYDTTAGSLLDLDNGNFTVGGSAAPVFSLNAAAKTGQLSGFSFNVTDMTSGSGSTAIGISTDPSKKAFWAGNENFYVEHDGTVKMKDGYLGQYAFDITIFNVGGVSYPLTTLAQKVTGGKTAVHGQAWVSGSVSTSANETLLEIIHGGVSASGGTVLTPEMRLAVSNNGIAREVVISAQPNPHSGTTPQSNVQYIPVAVIVGGATEYGIHTNGKINATGNFTTYSDRAVKRDINDINALSKLKSIKIASFKLDSAALERKRFEGEIVNNIRDKNAVIASFQPSEEYDVEDYRAPKYIGCFAGEFNKAFGVNGESEDTVCLGDQIGVALRAIQELAEIVDDQAAELAELRAALNLPERQKKQTDIPEFTAEEIEKTADNHVKAAFEAIMQEA